MNEHHFDKTKGQSAIEYLMTYGWMLLVVAIVGGAIFATVQGQCTQSTSGFTGGDVIVENFGIDSNNQTQMTVRNGGAETLTINNASIVNPDGENQYLAAPSGDSVDIGVGNSQSITLDNGEHISSSDGCNDFELEFNYTMGELSDQVSEGTLTDSVEFTGETL
ncbi:hypothetical protein HRED_01611 [Candidatus Haloredivivus sp. G17]|jgi:hypothetical protein|nr:hypothetical protein HRED_01611 [Candidatus Haloredivivus sp. G17]